MGALKRVICTSSLAVASLCVAPGESKAIFHWFKGGGCCGTPAPVAVAPPVVTPAVAAVPSCDPCQQSVAYVPQTTYRVQYVASPVTTYRPISSCGPCGGTTTSFMPVTSFQTTAQMVPTTSYRLVYPTAPVAATSYYTPVTASYATVAAPAASSSCCGGATTAAYAAPVATTYAAPQPQQAVVQYQQPYAQPQPQAYTQPQQQPYPQQQQQYPQQQQQPPQTYANGNNAPSLQSTPPQQQQQQPTPAAASPSDVQQQMKPIPDAGTNAPANPTSGGPALNFPARTTQGVSGDRWASTAQPAIHTVSNRTPIDDGGWRPAR